MSPAASATTAGRKRKGAPVRPRTGCKRRRAPAPAQEEASGWASLPADMARLVACRLLAEDVVDYLTFRAVCSSWRDSTSTLDHDFALRKSCFRPRGWVALCDGDAAPLDGACCEITMFHTRTARRLRIRLPELRAHRVVGFTDGLVVLLHKRKTTVRVVHPFTRHMFDLPPLAPAFQKDRGSLLHMSAFVCSSPSAPFSVVAHFSQEPVALWTQPGRVEWKVIGLGRGLVIQNILPFQGMLFATVMSTKEIVMAYPPRKFSLAYAPDSLANDTIWCQYLVEFAGRMMLVVQVQHRAVESQCAFKIFEVDIRGQKLLPVCSLGDHALFLHTDRCLCVSTMNLPSVCSNSVYFTLPSSPAAMQPLSTGLSEDLSELCQIHDMKEKIRPSVRPFTIADHLLAYCHHLEWARGLMFHEYHRIPESFEELHNKINTHISQLRIPQGAVKSKVCHD